MIEFVIRCISWVIIVFVVSVIIDSIDKKRKDSINKSQIEGYFIVKKPDAIKYLANFILIFGLLGALFFGILLSKNTETVSIGHVNVFLCFAFVGVLYRWYAYNKRIYVNGTSCKYVRLFHRSRYFDYRDVADIKLIGRSRVKFYDASNKWLCTVHWYCDNYLELENLIKGNWSDNSKKAKLDSENIKRDELVNKAKNSVKF